MRNKRLYYVVFILFIILTSFLHARHIGGRAESNHTNTPSYCGDNNTVCRSSLTNEITGQPSSTNETIERSSTYKKDDRLLSANEITDKSSSTNERVDKSTKQTVGLGQQPGQSPLTNNIKDRQSLTNEIVEQSASTNEIVDRLTNEIVERSTNDTADSTSLTNEITECSVRDYPYGWGLKGGNTGCCGNYPGCCKYASMFCWAHDIVCMCCGSIWCGPQCRRNPNCDQMLAETEQVDEGSGEI